MLTVLLRNLTLHLIKGMKMKIAIIPNTDKEGVTLLSQNIINILKKNDSDIFVHKKHLELFPDAKPCEHHFELAKECDYIIAVGGDGTILHAAKHAAAFNKPILGVNMGRLGYLAALESKEIELIPSMLEGKCKLEERKMLKIAINGKELPFSALNDAVFSGETAKLVDFIVEINGKEYSHRADGLIVSTPTGSTAYSLSAGGPVVDPTLSCMVFTPVCPFSLYDRSVIYGGNTKLRIKIKEGSRSKTYLSVDGNTPMQITEKDYVDVEIAEKAVKLIKQIGIDFTEVLSNKLLG